MKEKNNSKNWGIGSVSLILSVFATMFSFTFFNGKYFGEHILKLVGISLPNNEISLVMLVIALFIGYKYKENYLAKQGFILSLIIILLMFILILTSKLF